MSDILNKIKTDLGGEVSVGRYQHILSVCEVATKLADIYGVEKEKAEIAALMHDFCREWDKEKAEEFIKENNLDPKEELRVPLIHGLLGSEIARIRYGISDQEILKAIENHTLGSKEMGVLEKIIFIADSVASTEGLEISKKIYEIAEESLEKSMLLTYESAYKYFSSKDIEIDKSFFENWEANKKVKEGLKKE